MRLKLTKTNVDALAPASKHFEAYDTELSGLVFRVQSTGSRSWYFVYRHSGIRKRFKIGDYPGVSPDGARTIAKQLAGRVAGGIDVQKTREAERAEAQRQRASTLKAFLDQKYEPWATTHLRTADEQLKRIRADFADWMSRPIAGLSRFLVENWRKRAIDGGRKPRTVNRDLQRLSAAVAKAVEWGVIPEHPFKGLKPLKTDKGGRVRYLTADEECRLREALVTREQGLRAARDRFNDWRAARNVKLLPAREGVFVDHIRPMVILAMNTGLRRGELLALRWSDIAAKVLTVKGATAKTGQTRRVPLNVEAAQILEQWRIHVDPADADDFVFAGSAGKRMRRVDRSWESVVTLAKLADFRFHDLRHHFASRLVLAGVPLNHVRELLGHTDVAMTLRYAHLAPGALASAVEKLVRTA